MMSREAKTAWYEQHKWYWHTRKFGVTEARYNELLIAQGNRCAICRSETSRSKRTRLFAVDHDHATGKTRGLLCACCNTMLGAINDSVEALRSAIAYLESWR